MQMDLLFDTFSVIFIYTVDDLIGESVARGSYNRVTFHFKTRMSLYTVIIGLV